MLQYSGWLRIFAGPERSYGCPKIERATRHEYPIHYQKNLTEANMERHQCGEYATEHLNAKLTEGRENFLVALRDVAKAYGGMRQLSTESNLPRESVYRMLSKNGNPSFSSLDAILSALGLRLTVTLKEPKN